MPSVIKSQLNPLADTFIPNCRPSTSQKKSIWNSIENETMTTRKETGNSGSNDWDSKHEDLAAVIAKRFPKSKPKKDWADYVLLGGITSTILNFLLQKPFINKTRLSKPTKRQLPVLPKSHSQDDLMKPKSHDLMKAVEETTECNCPPMFGWSVPPDFLGNPFNFKYECSKRYPHDPETKGNLQSDTDNLNPDIKVNNLTLDECLSAMKDILTDVYETISIDSDTMLNCDEISKPLEVSDNGSRNEDKFKTIGFASPSEFVTEPELIDDGIHPLLQLAPTKEQDEKDLLKVEKILERSLSRSLDESFEVEPCTATVCDPPCSVWCEFLPQAAKDTFKKYAQKKGSAEDSKLRSFQQRPVFKRSLSADDAPMYARLNKGINQLDSREMLILRRKDPLSYFKVYSILMDKRKYISYGSIGQMLFGVPNVKSSMWGKVDSADSLWRPLPECLPVNVYPKGNVRRGHEAKEFKELQHRFSGKNRLQPTTGVAKHDQS